MTHTDYRTTDITIFHPSKFIYLRWALFSCFCRSGSSGCGFLLHTLSLIRSKFTMSYQRIPYFPIRYIKLFSIIIAYSRFLFHRSTLSLLFFFSGRLHISHLVLKSLTFGCFFHYLLH